MVSAGGSIRRNKLVEGNVILDNWKNGGTKEMRELNPQEMLHPAPDLQPILRLLPFPKL